MGLRKAHIWELFRNIIFWVLFFSTIICTMFTYRVHKDMQVGRSMKQSELTQIIRKIIHQELKKSLAKWD